MAARLPTSLRALLRSQPALRSSITQQTQRTFRTSRRTLAEAVVAPIAPVQPIVATRKPVGAFRGTLFGFLLGTVAAGGGLYYYVIDEYKVSNELLTEDIYALQAAVQRIEGYVKGLEVEVKTKK